MNRLSISRKLCFTHYHFKKSNVQHIRHFSQSFFKSKTPVTLELEVIDPKHDTIRPMFQMMDPSGVIHNKDYLNSMNKEEILHMYCIMNRVKIFDEILYNIQRQGLISFYLQSSGEEGLQVGSSAALSVDDMIFYQYRETGALFYRGFTIQQALDQCFSNVDDLGKGRQMPIHYGSHSLNIQTASSPLATQLPQAVGAAYAMKLAEINQTQPNLLSKPTSLVCCYFGEGAASEGDFHAAFNFASTLEVPIIFFCRNNGYAISTNINEQYRGDGIVSRAAGYGMKSIRVDGNDIFAVHQATAAAKRIALENSSPVLIEAMSYRVGHHSTSDDSTKYRSSEEIQYWQELCPIERLKRFMLLNSSIEVNSENASNNNLNSDRAATTSNHSLDFQWDEVKDVLLKETERAAILTALDAAAKKIKAPLSDMFTDVYHNMPLHLIQQQKEVDEHIQKYPAHYKSRHS